MRKQKKIVKFFSKPKMVIYTDFDLWYSKSNINNKNYLLVENRETIEKCLESKGLHFEDRGKYDSFPLPFLFKIKSVEIQKDKGVSFIYYGVFKVHTYSLFFGDTPWEYEMKYKGYLSVKAKRQLLTHLRKGGKPPSFKFDLQDLTRFVRKTGKERNPSNPPGEPSS